MGTSANKIIEPLAVRVRTTADQLSVELNDGRTISVPLTWYPRLAHGTAAERANWELIAGGFGIHWPALDEDVSVEGLLKGLPSGESRESLEEWVRSRR